MALVLVAVNANATISASPNPNSNGNYTVNWTPISQADEFYKLKQSYNGGPWTTYTTYPNYPYKAFSGKAPGTHSYKLHYCENLGHPDEYACYDSGFAAYEVVVAAEPWPDPDTVSNQLKYEFEVRIGHINGDGKPDVFVHRAAGGVSGNGTISDLIFQQQSSGGTFSSFPPSSTQIATASAWPLANVDVILADLNVDGFVDVQLLNLSTHIAGALDQIAYSSGIPVVNTPKAHVNVSPDIRQFSDELAAWRDNPNWFDNNASLVTVPGYWDWNPGGHPNSPSCGHLKIPH